MFDSLMNTTFWAEETVQQMWSILEAKNTSDFYLLGRIVVYLHEKCMNEYGWWCTNIP